MYLFSHPTAHSLLRNNAGYEPFLDHDTNPAHEVALSLNDTCDTVYLRQPHTFRLCFEGVSVPVNFEGSSWAAKEIRQDPDRWDGVVHLVSLDRLTWTYDTLDGSFFFVGDNLCV